MGEQADYEIERQLSRAVPMGNIFGKAIQGLKRHIKKRKVEQDLELPKQEDGFAFAKPPVIRTAITEEDWRDLAVMATDTSDNWCMDFVATVRRQDWISVRQREVMQRNAARINRRNGVEDQDSMEFDEDFYGMTEQDLGIGIYKD